MAKVATVISAEDGPAPFVLKACTMSEYLVDLRKPSIVYSKFRWDEEALLPAKLLFSRSRKEDADEKEDEVEPEMMIEDGTDTPAAADKEGEAGEPDDDDEEGFLSLAAGSALVGGCIGTCIVLYVKGSAEP